MSGYCKDGKRGPCKLGQSLHGSELGSVVNFPLTNTKRAQAPSSIKALEEEVVALNDPDDYAKDIADHGVFEESIIQVLSAKNLLTLPKGNV